MLKIIEIGEGQSCKVGPVRSHMFVIPLLSEGFVLICVIGVLFGCVTLL